MMLMTILSDNFLFAQENKPNTGTIKGGVLDKDTQQPLIGANVMLMNQSHGAATNKNGKFIIDNVQVGSHVLQFRFIGYEPVSVTDIIVRSDRITFVDCELTPTVIEGEEVLVTESFFPEIKIQPTSVTRFSNEEIRRAATIGGDINRIINGLPSLSNENQNNYIVARGGSNIENNFYIDNIHVPNINHFPIPGTTGGGVSLLNIDFIKDIDIYTGGFSAMYGNVLSSVMDIKYREGNRDETDLQFDLNFTGLSGAVEGPISNRGSYMLSAKHSFTDILFKIINIDQEPVIYDEVQAKIVYDLSPSHKLSLLQIFGTDRWEIPRDDALDRSENVFGNFNMTENVVGLNWQYLWGKKGYSNTSISHTFSKNKLTFFKTSDQTERLNYQTLEQELELRNDNYFIPTSNHKFQFGFQITRTEGDYDNYFAEYVNQYGTNTGELQVDKNISTWEAGGFLNDTWSPINSLHIISGVRLDYFSFNQNLNFSPRLAFTYSFNERTSLSGAAGIYYQHLPLYFLSQYNEFSNIDDMVANHFIFGINHLISEDVRLSLEVYYKSYRNCPMDEDQPSLFILDENIYNQFYSFHDKLVNTGAAKVQGIEFMLQKKFFGKFYGLISGTYYRAQYRDLDGIWRNRVTDNRYLIAAELGYKPDARWDFNIRWSYAGGIPYSLYDIQASQNAGTGVYDRTRIMSERLPVYSSVNVRVDHRFYFESSNLIIYLSIWNLFNRENVSYHFWDEVAGEAANYTQFPLIPVIGIEFEP
jgi:hypothetical protein